MPKSLETRNFSILNMKEDYNEASELLLKAMLNQNPEIDADSFDLRLRELISRFGNSSFYSNSAFATLAGEETNTPTVYSSAGDFLAIAYSSYHGGDKQQAVDMFETAMEEADARLLFEAILINNKRSALGIQADESDENPEQSKTTSTKDADESSEDDNNEMVELPDDDDDNSDNLGAGRTTDDEIEIAKASLRDFALSLSEEESDTEEKPTETKPVEKKPMSKVEPQKEQPEEKTEKESVSSQLIRAAGNKLSLVGSAKSRQEAVKFKNKAQS